MPSAEQLALLINEHLPPGCPGNFIGHDLEDQEVAKGLLIRCILPTKHKVCAECKAVKGILVDRQKCN